MSQGDLGRVGWKVVVDDSELLPSLRAAMSTVRRELEAGGLRVPITAGQPGAAGGPATFGSVQTGITGTGTASSFSPSIPSQLVPGISANPLAYTTLVKEAIYRNQWINTMGGMVQKSMGHEAIINPEIVRKTIASAVTGQERLDTRIDIELERGQHRRQTEIDRQISRERDYNIRHPAAAPYQMPGGDPSLPSANLYYQPGGMAPRPPFMQPGGDPRNANLYYGPGGNPRGPYTGQTGPASGPFYGPGGNPSITYAGPIGSPANAARGPYFGPGMGPPGHTFAPSTGPFMGPGGNPSIPYVGPIGAPGNASSGPYFGPGGGPPPPTTGGLPFGMQMGKGFLNFKAGLRMGMFQSIFGMWEASQMRNAADEGALQSSMARSGLERLKADTGALQMMMGGPMMGMLSEMGALVGVGPRPTVQRNNALIATQEAIEQTDLSRRFGTVTTRLTGLMKSGAGDYDLTKAEIEGNLNVNRDEINKHIRFEQAHLNSLTEQIPTTRRYQDKNFHWKEETTYARRGSDADIAATTARLDQSREELDKLNREGTSDLAKLDRQSRRASYRLKLSQEMAHRSGIVGALDSAIFDLNADAAFETEMNPQLAGAIEGNRFQQEMRLRREDSRQRGAQTASMRVDAADSVLARSLQVRVLNTLPGIARERVGAQADYELAMSRTPGLNKGTFGPFMGSFAMSQEQRQLGELRDAQLGDMNRQKGNEDRLTRMGLAGEKAFNQGIIDNMSAAGLAAIQMGTSGRTRMQQFIDAGEPGFAAEAGKNTLLGLEGIKKEYLRGFRGQEINLATTDVTNTQNQSNPNEVLKSIEREVLKIAEALPNMAAQ